jgi:hypothetical protein
MNFGNDVEGNVLGLCNVGGNVWYSGWSFDVGDVWMFHYIII